MTYGINPSGDTILVYKYEKDGHLLKQTTDYRKPVFDGHSLTIWYSGNRTVKRIDIDNKLHFRVMKTYGYDEKGNEIYEVTYQ